MSAKPGVVNVLQGLRPLLDPSLFLSLLHFRHSLTRHLICSSQFLCLPRDIWVIYWAQNFAHTPVEASRANFRPKITCFMVFTRYAKRHAGWKPNAKFWKSEIRNAKTENRKIRPDPPRQPYMGQIVIIYEPWTCHELENFPSWITLCKNVNLSGSQPRVSLSQVLVVILVF